MGTDLSPTACLVGLTKLPACPRWVLVLLLFMSSYLIIFTLNHTLLWNPPLPVRPPKIQSSASLGMGLIVGQMNAENQDKKDITGTLPQVCPAPRTEGNNNNNSVYCPLDFNKTNVSEVEKLIFRDNITKVRQIFSAINTINRLITQHHSKHDGARTCVKNYFPVAVNDYIYTPGGHWRPAKCVPRWKVAVIIPFRDRHYQLPILLKHLIPFLQKQYLEFGIFVPEQANDLIFNKAMLMNIAFVEALNISQWDCFIFHDVDHVPINPANFYGCDQMPRHFQSGVDEWEYGLLYDDMFGGVIGLTTTQFKQINGFSNSYWGWGGEDDDINRRIKHYGFNRTRPVGPMGYYNVIGHHELAVENENRWCLLLYWQERISVDGLRNLQYPKPEINLQPLYTNISIDITPLTNDPSWAVCHRFVNHTTP